MHLYLSLKVYQVTTTRDTSGLIDVYNTTMMELSTSEWNKRFYSKLGVVTSQSYDLDSMICTDSISYNIGGNSLSSEYNYIHIVLQKWSGQSYCKSDNNITAALKNLKIGVALTDYYFDGDNYDNPLQINPATGYEYIPISSMKKNVIIKIHRTELQDGVNYFTYSFDNFYKFYSIGEQVIDLSEQDNPGEFMNIDLVLDNKYQAVNRQVFTLIDLAVYVGGIVEVCSIVGSFIVGIFAYKIYISTVISHLFQTHDELKSKSLNGDVLNEEIDNGTKFVIIYRISSKQNKLCN